MVALTSVASAAEPKTKITYVSYMPSEILEEASQTNAYSDLIEYTFINYYDRGVGGTSPEIIDAAESGFFELRMLFSVLVLCLPY